MNTHDLPLSLTVHEVANILRVGVNKAYEIVRMPGFPAIRLGSRIIIPRDAFLQWMNNPSNS
ncbi:MULTISPECIES: helix-turn-helix domain-containing protein [Bacillales]|uniref:DNA binding, excisionase family domain protein n=1 Tax=Anoxybacteroides amylolyticum TaxID=294699 RepID=A0A160F487_9BACL|nr:helix-turn-helix domain-containing protein [Neobacillus fumarioli]ANB61227.1 DNA binding, excisionase family domain protein [Anoxybacillus amylolyticus]